MVYDAAEGKTQGMYHSSKYAAMKDAEWVEFKKAAIEESNKRMAAEVEKLSQLGL